MSTKNMTQEEVRRRDTRTAIRARNRSAKERERYPLRTGEPAKRAWVGTRPETQLQRERDAEARALAEAAQRALPKARQPRTHKVAQKGRSKPSEAKKRSIARKASKTSQKGRS